MLAWHVVRTQPARAFLAERSLVSDGFNIFLPKVRDEKRWSRGRTHEIVRPLVAGYLFVNFDDDTEGWQKINDAPGVLGLMYAAPEVPVRIPDIQMTPLLGVCEGDWKSWLEVVEYTDDDGNLKRRSNVCGGFVPKAQAKQFIFKVGSIVKVTEGPFASFIGPVTKATFDKVTASITVFGRATPVEGSSMMFEPV